MIIFLLILKLIINKLNDIRRPNFQIMVKKFVVCKVGVLTRVERDNSLCSGLTFAQV